MKRRPIEERFWENVVPEPNSGCWIWCGYVDYRGYGRIGLGGRHGGMTGAHRVSLAIAGIVVPKTMLVLHKCDVPCCVNPDHLFVGTQRDNIHDMISKSRHVVGRISTGNKLRGKPRPGRCFQSEKTHCKHGHSLADAYRYWFGRVCRTCAKINSAKQKLRNRAGAMSLREQTK